MQHIHANIISKTEFKVGDMVLLKIHTQKMLSMQSISLASGFVKESLTKLLMYKIAQGRSGECVCNILQLIHPTEHVLTHLPDITSFG